MEDVISRRRVVVAGDVVVSCHVVRLGAPPARGPRSTGAAGLTRLTAEAGGAARLTHLLRALANGGVDGHALPWDVLGPSETDFRTAAAGQLPNAHAVWEQVPALRGRADQTVWRVAERLGVEHPNSALLTRESVGCAVDESAIDLLILNDGALGFREAVEWWQPLLDSPRTPRRVLLKMAGPVVEGALWGHLLARFADRLVVLVSADDLRQREVRVSRELSWEQTAEDLSRELVFNPALNPLCGCAHVVVLLGPSGALHFDSVRGRISLTFDPSTIGSEWLDSRPGTTIGSTSCMAASLANTLLLQPERPRLADAIDRGLHAIRRLHAEGHDGPAGPGAPEGLTFPTSRIVEALRSDTLHFSHADVPDPVRARPPLVSSETPQVRWSIARVRHKDELRRLARDIALHGLAGTLRDVPTARFGSLTALDRDEIESYRTIRNLIRDYCDAKSVKQPLCLGVFGAPGTGKSFGVEQVARSVLPGMIEKLTFNLSQLVDSNDLIGAFHQVRDVGLRGKVPLVFWDEFDTALGDETLGWLHLFLAPMQDGSFQDGQLTHPIGRAVFVFAGGTSSSMQAFARSASDVEFQRVKGPDFTSRLRGFVNVLGPNRRQTTLADASVSDPYFVVRRAMLLRSMLERDAPQLVDHASGKQELRIDPGVLRAFLDIPEYRYGARSIEAIIAMSALQARNQYQRSSLPPTDQLDLHVDGARFLRLAQQIEIPDDDLERLADCYHDDWLQPRLADGWTWGPVRKDKQHPLIKPYAELDERDKEMNRTAVKQLPMKLAEADYVMVRSDSGHTLVEFSAEDVERMAKAEHWLWCEWRESNGYRAGTPSADDPYWAPNMVPWDQLSPEIQETNRIGVRAYPRILARAGYAIRRARVGPLRIGVTGHRVLADLDKVVAGVDDGLTLIRARFPQERVQVVTALAEGADRIVVKRARACCAATLRVVLPLPVAEYEQGLTTNASRQELASLLAEASEVVTLPPSSTTEAAFEAAGYWVLDHCDILFAIWDGLPAQASSGTGTIVAAARQRGLPLVWVRAGNRTPGTTEPTSLGDQQGHVETERFPLTKANP
jgi:hypothetical protein